MSWSQSGTLTDKSLTFGTGASIEVFGSYNTLTLGPTSTATGNITIFSKNDLTSGFTSFTNQGTITHDSGSGRIYANTFTNTGRIIATNGSTLDIGNPNDIFVTTINGPGGTITADGAKTVVYLNNNFPNQGTLIAQNSGQLIFRNDFRASWTTQNLGAVQIVNGGHAYISGSLNNTGATLTAPIGGTFELASGVINNGTIAAGALTFAGTGSLNNATLLGDLVLPANTTVGFFGGANFTGPTATLGSGALWRWSQSGTLADKTVIFGQGAAISIDSNTLTLGPTTTATGQVGISGTSFTNLGTIRNTSSGGSLFAQTFLNSGNITATNGELNIGTSFSTNYAITNGSSGTITTDGPNSVVYLNGNILNQGTLIAKNSGQLFFRTIGNLAMVTANLGTIQIANGGHVYLGGTLDNTGATLTAPSGGSYELYGGTINNGTIAPGALSFTSSGGTLSNVSLSGNFALSGLVTFTNGTNFTGSTATLNGALNWSQDGTLTGKTITLGSSALISLVGNHALTLGTGSSLTGTTAVYSDFTGKASLTNQGTITHNGAPADIAASSVMNYGTIAVTGGVLTLGNYLLDYTTTNAPGGSIVADGGGMFLDGNFLNQGTVIARNGGSISFRSGYNYPMLTANLGAVQIASGGHVYLVGTLDNTGATLNPPSGGAYELYGQINNGTIAPGALTFNSGGLNNVSLAGDLVLGSGSGGTVSFTGGTTFSGSNATLGNSATLGWGQSGSLNGKSITFGSGATIYLDSPNQSLMLGPTTTATGNVRIIAGYNGSVITNQGSVTHTTGSGELYAPTFTNLGTIVASGGSLTLGTAANTGWSFSNASGATIRTTGTGSVQLQAPGTTQIVNNGTIDVQSGTLTTNNHLTNGAGGVIRGSGTIAGNVIAAGGTVAPGNSIGTLTFQNGTLNVTSASVFAVELGGASSDQLVFNNPPSVVSLGTGLLTLSLTLLAPPAENTTYDLIRISSGGSGITGTFAGLPLSGNTITAVYADTTYTFGVNYAPNLVSLNFASVPEPSTYALIALGGALLAIVRRRR